MKKAFNISDLIVKHLKNELEADEQIQLSHWLSESISHKELLDRLSSDAKLAEKFELQKQFNSPKVRANLHQKLFTKPKIISLKLMRYAAAILLPIALIAGGYLFFKPNKNIQFTDTLIVPNKKSEPKATLVLSTGKKVILNKSNTKKVFSDKGIEIADTNRMLTYIEKLTPIETDIVLFNTLKTPRGSNYSLVLSDGTKVWLNADSQIKFPVLFSDSVRQVFISGEAYFEVAHNGRPFIVSANEMEVRVLGTKFNVQSYLKDELVKTTLIEGKVQVKSIENKYILKPNEQAIFNKNNNKIDVNKVDTDIYTAWLNGKFVFRNEPLNQVVLQLARWYDFEYSFSNTEAKMYHYTGRLSRTASIEELLRMLAMTTDLDIEFNNNKVTIK